MSKTIALVIEDDEDIRQMIVERLDSMGHDSDAVGSHDEARKRLSSRRYDYVLLDLELPFRFGRPSDLEIGKNILQEIRGGGANASVPVLIVTAHGHDEPDLAVDLMKAGATDFIKKPLKKLEEKIREALAKTKNGDCVLPTNNGEEFKVQEQTQNGSSSPANVLRFSPDEITFAGTPVCHPGKGAIWALLLLLRQRRENGQFRGFSAKSIADHIKLSRGQNAACELISKFRQSVNAMLRELGCTPNGDAVIISGKSGYQLNPALDVIDEIGEELPETLHTSAEIESRDRASWILEQIKAGKPIRRRDVEEHFGISTATAKRDLKRIEDQVEYRGSSRNGIYASR